VLDPAILAFDDQPPSVAAGKFGRAGDGIVFTRMDAIGCEGVLALHRPEAPTTLDEPCSSP
jgi:hypothetical protein